MNKHKTQRLIDQLNDLADIIDQELENDNGVTVENCSGDFELSFDVKQPKSFSVFNGKLKALLYVNQQVGESAVSFWDLTPAEIETMGCSYQNDNFYFLPQNNGEWIVKKINSMGGTHYRTKEKLLLHQMQFLTDDLFIAQAAKQNNLAEKYT